MRQRAVRLTRKASNKTPFVRSAGVAPFVIVSLNGGVVRVVAHLTSSNLLPMLSVAHCEICVMYVVETIKSNFRLGRSDLDDVQLSADETLDVSRSDRPSANNSQLSTDELRRMKLQVVARSEEVPIVQERDAELVSPSDVASGEHHEDGPARLADELKSELSRLQSELDGVQRSAEGSKLAASTANRDFDRTLMMLIAA
jgi:hypothetical protein